MRSHLLVALCVSFALVIFVSPFNEAHAQDYIEYRVLINNDGSTAWSITQASDINVSRDTWENFQQRVITLVDAAKNLVQRQMTIDLNSFEMTTTNFQETQSKTTTYKFIWLNSTIIREEELVFGDIFLLNGFFSQLYGEGTIQITYPQAYDVQSASPTPNQEDESIQTLKWFRTQDFLIGRPNIALTTSSQTPSPPTNTNQNELTLYVLIGISSAIVLASTIGISIIRRRKQKTRMKIESINLENILPIEIEEQKILRILHASGGSAFQSIITEQAKFSKAKTSQLLTAMENKGTVRRYKKGRDKIVTLTERAKSG
jgi:uncharacterized membrane protein